MANKEKYPEEFNAYWRRNAAKIAMSKAAFWQKLLKVKQIHEELS